MCLYPRLISNPKYKANKKNGGNIPPVFDKRTLSIPVGCGKCIECKKQKAREWQVRLSEEIRHDKTAHFITLTLSNESYTELDILIDDSIKGYERENEIATIATRRFLERWRKKHKKSVKHWFTTELGSNGTENIHIHGLIWTDKANEISNIWQYGHVFIGEYVNERTINYIIKYINKIDEKHKEYNSKILTSAGIGKKYIERIDAKKNKYKKGETDESYKTRQNFKLALPIYYRNKLYTEEEREKLWLEKLDKNKRFILGNEYDTSTENGLREYTKALKEAQRLNKRLGYGDSKKNWEQEVYEEKVRELLRLKRLQEQ